MNLPIQLSIVAPCYNEAEGIEATVRHWHHFLKQQKYICSFEIVICNDGSTDNTRNILEKLNQEFSELHLLHFESNQGAAAALNYAISITNFDWVLLTDSDNQFPIENLTAFIETLKSLPTHVHAMIGIREKKSGWFSRIGSKISGNLCNWIHKSKITDFNSAFKLVEGPLLRSLHLEAVGMNYSTEITSKLLEKRINLTEIKITHNLRTTGKSHLKLLRDSNHRILFICYLAFRRLLQRFNIIQGYCRANQNTRIK